MGGDDAFADVLAANARFAAGYTSQGLPAKAARGLAVLTCIDSRLEPLAMLGLVPGDAKIMRNAGARVTDDVIRSLVIAANLLNVRRLMVVAHTHCAMQTGTDAAIRTAILDAGGPDTGTLPLGATTEGTLAEDVARARESPLLAGLEVGGFLYDIDRGSLTRLA